MQDDTETDRVLQTKLVEMILAQTSAFKGELATKAKCKAFY